MAKKVKVEFEGLSRQEMVEALVKGREFLKVEPNGILILKTSKGYWTFSEAYFGDFNLEDQDAANKHWEEVTCFGGNGEFQEYIPIEKITSITYYII